MSNIQHLVRPNILTLSPYRSARTECEGSNLISLDANENPNPPYGENAQGMNRYPEPQPEALRKKLADLYAVHCEQLLITRGMDEGIDVLVRVFCIPDKDSITVIAPTFGYYAVSAHIQGASVNTVSTIEDIEDDTKVIFICTPNNPSGETVSLDKISDLCSRYAGRALIAVDEAYIEFSDQASASTLLARFDNLVVMRTLSKAYGLAGARIGAVLSSPEIISFMRSVLPPYPIPKSSASVALQALSPIGLVCAARKLAEIKKERAYLLQKLTVSQEIVKVYPSEANFILVIAKDAEQLYSMLKAKGIIVRKRTNEIENALRITVGTATENRLLLSALGLEDFSLSLIRQSSQTRITTETEILCNVALDGKGTYLINTGVPFFDHMIEQLSRHSGISITIEAMGDTQIDVHHTVEDVAITLGLALKEAFGNKIGFERYGFVLPMDESLAQVSIDLSGRGFCGFNCVFPSPYIGTFGTEMVKHFFLSLSEHLGACIHISATGENTHHMIESIFKAFARALKQATKVNGEVLASTKGVL